MLKRLFSSMLPASYRRRVKLSFGMVDHESRLENLRRCGFNPRTVIDGGAYRGAWTSLVRRLFPTARVLLIEPQPKYAEQLRRSTTPSFAETVCEYALGQYEGVADFHLGESNSYLVGTANNNTIKVTVRPLDDILTDAGLSTPDLIKLDVQGAELKALEGGRKALAAAEVVCLEISLLRIGEVPLFHEVIAFMEEAGFRLYDVYGQNYRPLDRALWQLDTIFVSHRSPLIASRDWDANKHPTSTPLGG